MFQVIASASVIFLCLVTILFYLPVFINPQLVLGRGNDLREFFWPLFLYVKTSIFSYHSLPLWNNSIFSGTPLLPDPQSFLFYLPNILFLFLPINIAFIISFAFHTLLGGIGMYLSGRKVFKFSAPVSVFVASLYMLSPKLAGYLEAGHYGLAVSWAWLPFVFLSTVIIARSPTLLWSAVLGISLNAIFFSHTITFILATVVSFMVYFFLIFTSSASKKTPGKVLFFLAGGIIAIALSAVTLFPQLDWAPDTTRSLLTQQRDTYPKWFSKKEFILSTTVPWISGLEGLWQIDTEKWLGLGISSLFLALVGFIKINMKHRIAIVALFIPVNLISLNNASPIYNFLLDQDWFALMRVSTRVWFISIFIVIFLAGIGMEFLIRKVVSKKIAILIILLASAELLSISWARMSKPLSALDETVPQKIYETIKNDPGRFRVFCLNRCIPQKNAVENKLELIEGYNTLSQKNYYQHMWQLSGAYWNYYTLALPPIGSYTFEKLQPNFNSLGEYNAKYIISPWELNDKNAILKDKADGYFLYQNSLWRPRAYFKTNDQSKDSSAPILIYTPNHIRVDTTRHTAQQLILAEVFSRGWKAYLSGRDETAVLETPNSQRLVDIKNNTDFVDFKYDPQSYQAGKVVTSIAVLVILGILVKQKK